MRYVVRTLIGFGLLAFAWVALGYSIYQLLQIGTCASGGPYVSARPCPGGIERLILMIFGGVIALLAGAWIYSGRGKAPGSDKAPRNELIVIWVWTGIFWSIAAGSLLAVWGPDANPGPGAKEGGLIVGFLFVLMGAGGLLVLGRRGTGGRAAGGPAAGPVPVGASLPGGARLAKAYARRMPGVDPVDRLERLAALRDKGAISEAEFQQLKREVMGGGA